MLVSITSTTSDATDLGYLLHKHPDRVRSVELGFGTAHVFYPEASAERCTATLMAEVDPIGLSRGRKGRPPTNLEPYVNDRPYASSSLLSVAIGKLFGTAMSGVCDNRPELVDAKLDLEIELPVLVARGGEGIVNRLFEPLGYEVEVEAIPLDDTFPAWGPSPYVSARLKGSQTVRAALEHLYVMIPVLDGSKHYWVGEAEIDKLLRKGADWLSGHPEAEFIARRYLRFGGLAREALSRLSDPDPDVIEVKVDRPPGLNEARLVAVVEAVRAAGGGRVVDLGCGEGKLLRRLLSEPTVDHVLGMDVSLGVLERAEKRLHLDDMSERRRERISLIQGALTYTDERTKGYDIACVVEVIEHLDADRLDSFARVLFGQSAPATVILTTPNREYNANYPSLGPSSLRHGDHRFEWTWAEFGEWAASIESDYGYSFVLSGVGDADPELGTPTQMGVFRR